jgi:hypothetical protein
MRNRAAIGTLRRTLTADVKDEAVWLKLNAVENQELRMGRTDCEWLGGLKKPARLGRDLSIVTLKDVARAAGVSTATVSRVLNQASSVTDDTRNRVLWVLSGITKLGYIHNTHAAISACRRRSLPS